LKYLVETCERRRAAKQRGDLATFHSAPKPTLPIDTALGGFSRSSVNEKAI
jgi:hypothetical protein